MFHFLSALKQSLRYRWSIAGAVICSLMVAMLWSASITTVFPLVETVFERKTFPEWAAEGLQEAEERRDKLQQEITALQVELADSNKQSAVPIQADLAKKQDFLLAETKAVEWFGAWQPTIERYAPATPFGSLLAAMAFLVIATAIKGVFLILSCLCVARVANGTVMDMRRIYYRKAMELDQLRIDRIGTSNMMTHLAHNMMLVSGALTMFYGKSIREPLKMITCLSIAAWISFPLLLISLTVVPFGAILVHRVSRGMKNATRKEVEGMADIFETLIETFGSIKTVRIFNQESTERKRFKSNSGMLYRMAMRMRFYDALLRPTTELLGIVAIAVSILAGAWLTLSGSQTLFGFTISERPLSPGELMLFYGMLAGASDPARKMSEIINVLVRGGTACEALNDCYDVESKVTAPANPTPLPLHAEEIEFDNVLFAYMPHQPVVKNVSFKIPYGQTLVIVGENGSGKSTLVNLLARFYDPHVGRILIDGVNIRETNPKKLRRQIAWVTQDSALFQGTVYENIAYGTRNPDRAQVMAAARMARVDQFIEQLGNGYETQVGEGGKQLSAGQRQRVILARAIVADPQILILDEATSQLDGHTERLLHDSLAPFIKSRTTIIITHRISTVDMADRVIVMESGKVVSDSTPEEAANSSEKFQFLFAKSA
ncbi:MAG: ABC transporter ATP-binding protein [Planctomycetaceae bacterium]|nr:ABC transporter ATP-binding protein [Planctomycetaceae bacterium]MDG1809687.1 ABC transporter ATP-binding protein [Pirellulaceae bacterium]MDG2103129.1 ABC transporter ATP-binding protein [Pirellulaceae bacterium]